MSLFNLSKDSVFAVQPWGILEADEELGSVGVGASIGHGKNRAFVLELEVLTTMTITVKKDSESNSTLAYGNETCRVSHPCLLQVEGEERQGHCEGGCCSRSIACNRIAWYSIDTNPCAHLAQMITAKLGYHLLGKLAAINGFTSTSITTGEVYRPKK